MNTSSRTEQGPRETRRFGTLAFFAVGFVATQVGFRWLGGYFYLVHTYGLSRVWSEHLHLVRMGKSTPWLVSNGDQIPSGEFLWFLVAIGITAAFFFPVFALVWRLLPRRKDLHAGQPHAPPDQR
jgi:hypothetical protein